MLDTLNDKQKEAVLYIKGPLMIIAGAGSGKTRVLTTRIKYLLAEKKVLPERILAVTFTNKAAREMEERIGVKLPWIGTFHGICGKLLRRHIHLLPGYTSSYVIYDDTDQAALIKRILRESGLEKDRQFTPQKILGQIGWAKNKMLSPEAYAVMADDTVFRGQQKQFRQTIAQIYKKYQSELRQNNALDFDDMLLLTIELLKNPDLLARYQEQFEYVLVDEYQDTNRAQYLLIHLLAAKHQNICVVGDSDQNIYSWRGADITNILSFEQDYPQAKVILLEQNYRSTANILNAANAVIKKNTLRKEKKLWTENPDGEKGKFTLVGSEKDEAKYVVDTITELQKEYALNSFAVFYRTNAQSRVFEDEFNTRNISYRLVGGVRFYARKEVKDILAYLRVIANPADSVSLQRIINLPARGLGELTVAKYKILAETQGVGLLEVLGTKTAGITDRAAQAAGLFKKIIQDMQTLANTAPLAEIINETIIRSGYRDLLANSTDESDLERLDNIFELVSVAKEKEPLGLSEFLEQVSLMTDIDNLKAEGDAVTLMTIHSAKGLEFPVVLLTGLEESILPHFRSLYEPAQLEEERRLCYVAITRAKKRVYLSAARLRSQAGETSYNEVSRFVKEIPEELLECTETEARLFDPVAIPEYLTRQAAPATQTNIEIYSAGDRLFHNKWGEGKVLRVFGSGADQALDIQFLRERKSILVKYANMKKL